MNDGQEESEQRRRDMIQIVWVLMPVAIFFVLLLLVDWFWLHERWGTTMYLLQGLIFCAVVGSSVRVG